MEPYLNQQPIVLSYGNVWFSVIAVHVVSVVLLRYRLAMRAVDRFYQLSTNVVTVVNYLYLVITSVGTLGKRRRTSVGKRWYQRWCQRFYEM